MLSFCFGGAQLQTSREAQWFRADSIFLPFLQSASGKFFVEPGAVTLDDNRQLVTVRFIQEAPGVFQKFDQGMLCLTKVSLCGFECKKGEAGREGLMQFLETELFFVIKRMSDHAASRESDRCLVAREEGLIIDDVVAVAANLRNLSL